MTQESCGLFPFGLDNPVAFGDHVAFASSPLTHPFFGSVPAEPDRPKNKKEEGEGEDEWRGKRAKKLDAISNRARFEMPQAGVLEAGEKGLTLVKLFSMIETGKSSPTPASPRTCIKKIHLYKVDFFYEWKVLQKSHDPSPPASR